MAEPSIIVTDPMSDGSEESWILLDEMDEAMREEFNISHASDDQIDSADLADLADSVDSTTSTDTVMEPMSHVETTPDVESEEIVPEIIEEKVVEALESEPAAIEETSNVETISSEPINDPSNDDENDGNDDTAHLHSVLEQKNLPPVYDDLYDGSTTDGSISILGDHEREQGRTEPDDLTTHTPSPQPSQLWMRCTPIDMAICAKRPLQPRSRNNNQCASPTSIDELELAPPNLIDDIANYLDRLNSFMSQFYLLQVFLLFLSAGLVTVLAVIYSRYTACKLEIKDLENKLYSSNIDRYRAEGNLAKCEYLYEMKTDDSTNSEFIQLKDSGDKGMPAVHDEPDCQVYGLNDECVIQPTKLMDLGFAEHDDDTQIKYSKSTIWSGADDRPLPTKERYTQHYDNQKKPKSVLKERKQIDKTQTIDHSVIKVEKFDDSSSEEHVDKKIRKEKKNHKDSDKENKRKNVRKDGKKHQDKDQNKWNKNDRKRDMVKVHDHRHDD